MKKLMLSIILGCGSLSVSAQPMNHPLGSAMTNGSLSIPHVGSSHVYNPATGASMLYTDGGGFGIGLVLGSVGLGLEVGPIEDIAASLDSTLDEFFSIQETVTAQVNSGQIPSLSIIQDIEDKIGGLLEDAGNAFYFDLNAAVQGPTPLVVSHTSFGSISFDMNIGAKAKLDIVDSPLSLDFSNLDEPISTNTSLYFKTGGVLETSLTYGREVFKHTAGTLYGGVTASYYMGVMSKSLIPILEYDTAFDKLGDDLEQLVKNVASFDTSQPGASSTFGLDLGAVWSASFYRAGMTIHNINAPSLDYPELGQNCDTDTCWVALSMSDKIDLKEQYTMNPQITIDGLVHTQSRTWYAGAALDLNAGNDYVGDEYQWFSVAAGYAPRLWSAWFIMPAVRAGFKSNLVGSQLSYLNFGLSWLFVNFDLAYSLTSFDASKVPQMEEIASSIPIGIPRGLAFNLGLHMMF